MTAGLDVSAMASHGLCSHRSLQSQEVSLVYARSCVEAEGAQLQLYVIAVTNFTVSARAPFQATLHRSIDPGTLGAVCIQRS